MKQMAGQGKARFWHIHFSLHPLGFLLFQIWLKMGLDLGETKAKSSGNLHFFSGNKICDKTKQALLYCRLYISEPRILNVSHLQIITCNHMSELKET